MSVPALAVNLGSQFREGKLLVVLGPLPLPGGAQSASVVLDGSGNGMVSVGPSRAREHWQVTSVFVSVSTKVLESQCSVFIGVPGGLQGQGFGQTVTGSSGDTCGMGEIDIQPGQVITAQWKNGDAGAIATMNVFGTYTIGVPV